MDKDAHRTPPLAILPNVVPHAERPAEIAHLVFFTTQTNPPTYQKSYYLPQLDCGKLCQLILLILDAHYYICQYLTSQLMDSLSRFGEMVRKLREQRNLLQRQVASKLEIDTPMLSKIERGERRAKREQVKMLAEILEADQEEMITLWLADKVYEIVKDESNAIKALQVAKQEISYSKEQSR